MNTKKVLNSVKSKSTSMMSLLALLLLAVSCGDKNPREQALPVLGPPALASNNHLSGETEGFPDFRLEDQFGGMISPDSLSGQLIVGDFFFSSCKGICRDQLTGLKKVYAAYGQDDRIRIVSHSIDPDNDTRDALLAYAQNAGVMNRNWLFLRGDTSDVYPLARGSYLAFAESDSLADGGYTHSGYLSLLDPQRRIRGIYDAAQTDEIDRLLTDIRILFAETHDQ
jgi:protein SCO1/2